MLSQVEDVEYKARFYDVPGNQATAVPIEEEIAENESTKEEQANDEFEELETKNDSEDKS